MTDDLKTIRDALDDYRECLLEASLRADNIRTDNADYAIAALDRIEPRVLPELPDGWRIIKLNQCMSQGTFVWAATVHSIKLKRQECEISVMSPRAAILSALEKLK